MAEIVDAGTIQLDQPKGVQVVNAGSIQLDPPQKRDTTLSWRQGNAPSFLERITDAFDGDIAAGSQKATNALTYSQMLNISPSQAWEMHDELNSQLKSKIKAEERAVKYSGMGGAIKSGIDTSIAGMMLRRKAPEPFESHNQAESWVQGILSMGLDLPFFAAGYLIGGGNPVSGTAGAFGFSSGLRKVLMDRYTKGEVKSAGELFNRTADAAKETIKGEVVGGFVGGAGYVAPSVLQALAPGASKTAVTGWKAITELATMTAAGKLIEGQLPTAKDFVDNAAMLAMMHVGIRGAESIKTRIPEVRKKLQEIYAETGLHPKEVQNIAAAQKINPKEDVIEVLDRVAEEIKQTLPPEPMETAKTETMEGKGPAEIVEPEPSSREIAGSRANTEIPDAQNIGKTNISNAVIEQERIARGEEPIDSIAGLSDKERFELAKKKVDDGEINPERIVERINNAVDMGESAPILDALEQHSLTYYRTKLKNSQAFLELEKDKAEAEGRDTTGIDEQISNIGLKMDRMERAARYTGTEQSATFRARQAVMDADYSWSGMIARAQKDGVDITPEIREKYRKMSVEVRKAEEELAGHTKKKTEDSLAKTIKQIQNEERLISRKQKRELQKEELDNEFDVLAKELNASLSGLHANPFLNPEAHKALVLMARNRIRKGIVTAEGIVDEIYTSLKNAGLEASKRDIRDAISNYGIVKEMSKEEIDVALREAKRQMQLISALEDAKNGQAPLKSGLKREKPSDKVREMQREVTQAMRESGIDSKTARSPEEQWKTSLDAVKSRLKNSIADLAKRMETGEPEPKKLGVKYDEDATDLARIRDKIKEVLVFAEGPKDKPQMPPEQKIRMATKALEKSITEYERRLTENDLKPRGKGTSTPDTPEIIALRKERDFLKELYKGLKDELKEKKTVEEKSTERAIKSTERSIAKLEKQIDEWNILPEKKKDSAKVTAELKALRDKRDNLKDALDDLRNFGVDKRSPEEQAFDMFRKMKEKQIKEYERRIKEGDFSKTPRKERTDERELELQYKVEQIKHKFEKAKMEDMLSQRGTAVVLKDSVFEAMNLIRAIKSSYDLSAPGRQGMFALLSHPITGMQGLPYMMRALKSEEAYFQVSKEIENKFNSKLYKDAKLALSEAGDFGSKAEEMYRSRWAENVPGIGASERAFVTYMNFIRMRLFDNMHEFAFKDTKATKAELEALGDYVNMATGRGNIKGYENALQGLGTFLWAPRLVLSRFQMALGKGLLPGGGRSAATRKAVLREYTRILGSLALVYSVSSFLGYEIGDDPRSSDFGKIIVGNTRVDPLAGVSQATVFMSRMWIGEKKSLKTGEIKDLYGDNVSYGGATVWSVMTDFLRTKLTPALGLAINLRQGKDLIGQPVTPADIPAEVAVPLSMKDLWEAMNEEGIPAGMALGTLGLFGVGVQTHEQRGAGR